MKQGDPDSRFELKYRISAFEYLRVKHALVPYMRKDGFTQQAPGKGYTVRSLYFDSDQYELYNEKLSGDNIRTKMRLRTYPNNPGDAVRAELKMRERNLVIKKTAPLSWEALAAYEHTGHFETEDPVLAQCELLKCSRLLGPKVVIEYEREGYQMRDGGGVRVTFDHRVRSAQGVSLTHLPHFFREHDPLSIILEIKFRDAVPRFLHDIVRKNGLKVIANSKFTQAIQLSSKHFYHSDHVVVLR